MTFYIFTKYNYLTITLVRCLQIMIEKNNPIRRS